MSHVSLLSCRPASTLCSAVLSAAAIACSLHAQSPAPVQTTPRLAQLTDSYKGEGLPHNEGNTVDRTYKLKYTQSTDDSNSLLTALRNVLDPQTKIFMIYDTGTIVVHAPEQVQATVAKLLTVLDQPHPRYRVTYTLTELDGTRKVGVQHFSLVTTAGQRTTLKQGSRLPVQTAGSQFTYLDVGENFEATVNELQGGAVLRSKIEQTSVAPDANSPSNPNPLIRQTLLEGTTTVALNKAQVIGSLDVPSSTHHFDVEVLVEPSN